MFDKKTAVSGFINKIYEDLDDDCKDLLVWYQIDLNFFNTFGNLEVKQYYVLAKFVADIEERDSFTYYDSNGFELKNPHLIDFLGNLYNRYERRIKDTEAKKQAAEVVQFINKHRDKYDEHMLGFSIDNAISEKDLK